MLPVSEIFASIDGEGLFSGCLASFIRLCGCNLRCRYCDTKYAFNTREGRLTDLETIINHVKEIGYKHVTLTGGEPLLYEESKDLVLGLLKEGFILNIETNGSIEVDYFTNLKNVTVTMDYKTPASGEESKMLVGNISKLREQDVLKFVLSEKDFDRVESVLLDTRPKCQVYLSPIFGQCKNTALVDFLKRLGKYSHLGDMTNYRVQVQLHKYIWPPEMRGV